MHILYEVHERGGSNLHQIPVDSYLSELTLSLSGDKDDNEFLDISIIDSEGIFVRFIFFFKGFLAIFENLIKWA